MIKVLCIGDPHVKTNNIPEIDMLTNNIIDVCKDKKPDVIICMGDILDRHATIHVAALMRAEKMLYSLSLIAPTFLIIGNHDRPNNSTFLTDEHPFNAMKLWPNTYIIDTTTLVYLDLQNPDIYSRIKINAVDNTKEYIKFLMVPYVAPGRLDEAINKVENPLEETSCVFGHSEIYKCKMGAIVSEVGDKWSLDRPLYVGGHIHEYDMLQENVILIGAPHQLAFGDSKDKTISLFKFYRDNHWEQERIKLNMIEKEIIYITVKDVESFKVPEGKDIKLVIKGEEAEIKAISKHSRIKELQKLGVKIKFSITPSLKNLENLPREHTAKITYKERLLHKCSKETDVLKWYNKLLV